jgi:hypothetical protein
MDSVTFRLRRIPLAVHNPKATSDSSLAEVVISRKDVMFHGINQINSNTISVMNTKCRVELSSGLVLISSKCSSLSSIWIRSSVEIDGGTQFVPQTVS